MNRSPTPPPSDHLNRPIQVDVRRVLTRSDLAFSMMSVIPLLLCGYLITVRFFSFSVLEGLNGIYLLLAFASALVGMMAGRRYVMDIIRQLIQLNLKLERLNDQQAAFVSNVAHEFRSPLAVFKGMIDNLADGLHGPLAPEQSEPVSICQKQIARLSRLVNDLLDIARIEAGKISLVKRDIVIQDLLASVSQLFQGLLKERGLTFAMELPEKPVTLLADRDRLEQVFVNLLGNAAKFTEAGSIRIRVLREPGAVRMEVEDTGPGIAAEDLERIFDKFERVGSQEEEGSGLGLPIARDIVELHGGRLWAESEPGRGSRFIVRLPLNGSKAAR